MHVPDTYNSSSTNVAKKRVGKKRQNCTAKKKIKRKGKRKNMFVGTLGGNVGSKFHEEVKYGI